MTSCSNVASRIREAIFVCTVITSPKGEVIYALTRGLLRREEHPPRNDMEVIWKSAKQFM